MNDHKKEAIRRMYNVSVNRISLKQREDRKIPERRTDLIEYYSKLYDVAHWK